MNKQVKRQKLFQIPAFLLAVLVALNVCVPIGYAGSPAPDVFTTKSFDNLPPLSMRDVAYGNSIYVAVGDKGTVVRSTDAEHWEVVIDRTNVVSYTGVSSPDDISFTGAAYGNGLFVISGSKGVILTSPDAQTWTKRDSGVTSDFTLADYFTLNGNGAFYVLSQGKYMTSTNGIDWTSVTPTGLASDRTLTQMTLGNNGTKLAFAADTGVIYYTANGSSWANVTPTSPDGSNFFRWMGNRYLFINIGGQILSSTDLTSFSSLGAGAPSAENSAGYLRMRTGLYDGQNYYLVGSQDGIAGITYKSSDGTTWTKQPFEREITTQNAEFLNGKYFMFGNEGMSISDTGSNWQYKWGQNFRDVAYNGSTYVAVGNTGQEGDIWSSSDLVNWTERTPNGFPGIFSAVAYGNGKYVAVSSPYQKETQIATSSDGLTWTLHQRPNQNETWKDIIFANGVFVAGQDSNILTSTDGLTWTTANVPTAFDSIVSIVYENNQFIALASESGAGKIYTSANGSAWLDRSSDYVNSSANSIDAFTGIVYDGSKYVLIGVETVSYMQFSRTSDDLTNWSSISLTGDSSLFETQSVVVAKGSDLYVLGVDSWTGLYTLYSSVNQGTNWQPTSSIPENANVYALKKINNEVIISGGSKFLKATGGVSSSLIAPVTAAFDKKTSAQADVEVTATWNGNTLGSITNGGTPLTADTDYTVVNNTVTIKKSYLTLQAIGATNLVFNFSAGNTQTLTVNVSDTTPQNSQIAPVTAAFDKKTSAQADVEVTATWNGNTLSSITNGGTPLTADTDYTVVNNTVTIKKSYLALQAVGSTNLVFNFSAGNTQTLTVNVSDTTPPSSQDSQLSTATAAFDKKVSAQADVSVNLTLNGNTFTGITNNGIPLLQDTDYTVAGSTVTINKTYLAQQPVGKTNLLFNFSAGISPALEVTISDTTPPSPQDSELSLQTAGFDKETSAQADVAVTLTLNGNTLNSIANNGTPLALNSDYTVVGDVVTINKSYLSQQPIGTTNLTFNFSAGAAKTLAVTVSDSTPPSPQDSQLSTSTAVFDKKVAAQADVNVTLTLNGNTLSSITNGGLPLLENTDYTLSGNAVTIGKSYLAQQPTGATNLVFNFSAGSSQLLTVTVSDSTPPNPQDSQLSTLTAVFDKKSTQQNDVTVVLNLNGNTFSGIANNGTPLVLGTDYTLAGDTVTINKSYLALQPVGTTNLAFNFSAGAAKTLTVTISDTTTEGVPAAPTRIVATAGDRQATVTFTPPTDNGGSPITGYEVLNSNEQVVATGTSSPIVVTGLTNGASYVFTVKALNTVGKSNVSLPSNTITPAAPSSGGSGTPAPTPSVNSGTAPTSPPAATSMGVDIWVNGRQERIGAANESTIGAKSAITISVDSALLQQKLAAEGNGPVITIPLLNRTSDIVIGELTGQMIKNMEQKNAVIELRTEQATYSVPAQQIRIDSVSQALGQSVSLDDVMIQIEVSSLTDDMARAVANAANAGNFTVEAPSLDFTVRAVYQNRTIPVTTFNVYVERKVVLPAGVDPSKITTGIVVEPNGTVRHVPTRVTQEDNQYFAIINSLSNSAYSVIWHPLEFTDVANHWSKDAVNDMGSRLVVNGTGGELFSPDEAITRAEFAAIIVRGLGLQEETGDTSFTDVSNSAWYGAAVHTANKHGLIQGFADGTFRPNEEITREQAMAILAKAMVITGLQSKEANSAGTLVPYSDIDQLGSWAREAAEVVIQAQIVQGRTDQNLAPKMNMTRAEVAAVIQRLLKVSGLI